MKRFTDDGAEIPDPRPVEVPVRFRRTEQDALHDEIRKVLWSQAVQQKIAERGFETPEEADDFDVDDDHDADLPLSPAERASLMAEELQGARGDLAELEGELRARGGSRSGEEERVPAAAGAGVVRQGEGHEDVSGGDAGGGASSVRPVESAAGVREGRPGGKGTGKAVRKDGA